MPAYTSLDEVVTDLAALEHRFLEQEDRRAIFATLYGVVSAEMRARVARGAFLDSAWVHRYAVAFASFYREALDAYDGGRMSQVPRAWRLCFDAAASRTGFVLQDMLLGINAHVNNDLPLALHRVTLEPDRDARRRDHNAVNEVLAAVTDRATLRLAALYAPGLVSLDECAGQLDELIALFSLQVARDSSWESAVSFANARTSTERALVAGLVSSRAAVLARLLLAPSRNAAFVDACRRLEQRVSVRALLADVRKELAMPLDGNASLRRAPL
jgi:hypothetical protein